MPFLSTKNLSADGTTVTRGTHFRGAEVDEAAAVAALRAFASIPSVQLVDANAKIYLSGAGGKFAVQHVTGRLFFAPVPEMVAVYTEATPEGILAVVTANPVVVGQPAATATAAPVAGPNAPKQSAGFPGVGAMRRSPWLLGVLVLVAAVVAYFRFSPPVADGVTMISDPGEVARLHTEFNGRYGNTGQSGTQMVGLENGTLTDFELSSDGRHWVPLYELSYRFGTRNKRIVLVTENGAIWESMPDHGLRFLHTVYPRWPKDAPLNRH